MFVLQHVWTRWTKASRSAETAARRLAVAEAWPLRPPPGRPRAWLDEISAQEAADFDPRRRAGELTRSYWEAASPAHAANLRWEFARGGVRVSLTPPWPSMRRTRWPDGLADPLFELSLGETARIDWNARFQASAAGAARGYFYDAHTYWLAVVDEPRTDLFLNAKPRRRVDLRTKIY